jgi:hypothetical protein
MYDWTTGRMEITMPFDSPRSLSTTSAASLRVAIALTLFFRVGT